MSEPETRMDEYDKIEWFDVARVFLPNLTHEEFDVMWAEFQQAKAAHKRELGLQ